MKLIKKIVVLIILVFLVSLLYLRDLLVSHTTQSFLNHIDYVDSLIFEGEEDFDFSAIENFQTSDVIMALVSGLSVMGEIKIPSVDLHLAIIRGVSGPSVSVGAGTMRADQQMGMGNFPLASHYLPGSDLLFSPLHRVEIGAKIYLLDDSDIYIYAVTEMKIVEPHQVEVIEDQEGRILVTLVTCTSDMENRLIVMGEFVGKEPKNTS